MVIYMVITLYMVMYTTMHQVVFYSDEKFFSGFNKRQTLFKLVFIFATFVFYTRIIRVSVVSDLNLERPS